MYSNFYFILKEQLISTSEKYNKKIKSWIKFLLRNICSKWHNSMSAWWKPCQQIFRYWFDYWLHVPWIFSNWINLVDTVLIYVTLICNDDEPNCHILNYNLLPTSPKKYLGFLWPVFSFLCSTTYTSSSAKVLLFPPNFRLQQNGEAIFYFIQFFCIS